MKLEYGLPLAHVGVAVVFLWCHRAWEMATSLQDMPGTSPWCDLLGSIDWPVVFIPKTLTHLWYSAIVTAFTGLFWYWLAVNFKRLRQRQGLLMFRSVPWRITGDLFLLFVGACFAVLAVVGIRRWPFFYYPRLGSRWLLFLPTVSIQFAWFFVLYAMFGRDLIRCVFRKNATPKF